MSDINVLLERLEKLLENVHQYVGARYIPNFIDDPWNDTTSYEALDVVDNGQGTSYIAKKPVPAGTPLSDRKFWFLYGTTSGAIINLQNQIDAIVSNVQDLMTTLPNNKNLLLISDSYGMRPESQPTWTEILTSNLSNCRQKSAGGYGFTIGNFKSQLMAFKSELTDTECDEVTDIVVGGGWNDARELTNGSQTVSTLQAAIFDFVDYAVANFKNAKVWVAFIAWQSRDSVQLTDTSIANLRATQDVYNNSVYDNLNHIANASYPMKCTKLLDSSYFHPNPTGSSFLAHIIANNLYGHEDFIYEYELSANDITITSGSATFRNGSVQIVNGIAKVIISFSAVTTDNANHLVFTIGANVLPSGHNYARFYFGYDYTNGIPVAIYVNIDRTCTCYYASSVSNGSLMIDETISTEFY